MNKYQILFEVKFYHQYYDGYTAKDFDILLGPGTAEILSGHQLIYRSTPDGFVVLYNEDKKFLLENLREKITLTFGTKSRNNHFETFTNIKPINQEQKYFFNNQHSIELKDNTSKESVNKVKLHGGEFVNQNNLFLYGSGHTLVKEVLGADEVSIGYGNSIVFEGILKGDEHFASLLKSDYGRYDVTLKTSRENLQVYYLPTSLEKALAVIEISLGGVDAQDFNQIKGKEFHLRFENRSILWTYYFVSESGNHFEKAEVFSGKDKLSFTPAKSLTLVNGQIATKVTSLKPIPLEYRFSGKQIHAELTEQRMEAAITDPKNKINLPTPNVLKIKGMKIDDREVYFSEMFVYV